MKIGLISDIHANLNALTKVLSVLRKEDCVKILCIGDVVGYGPRPQECVDIVRAHKIPTVVGNHDDWIASYLRLAGTSDNVRDMIIWTKKQLTDEATQWIKELPQSLTYAGLQVVHASNGCERRQWPYVRDRRSLEYNFRHQEHAICFNGHTHRPAIGMYREGEDAGFIQFDEEVHLPEGYKYLINPGSVGQPRDGDPRAAFATYDTKTRTVRFYRVEYDIAGTQDQMEAAGLPEPYINRLGMGK